MANMHELFTVLKLTENFISLTVLYVSQSLVQCACQLAASARTLNLLVLLHRPHHSMQVNSSCWTHHCNGDVLARQIYHQAMTKNRLRFSLGSRLSGLLSRLLETHGTLRRLFENASLWLPLFVHTALQF